MASATTTDKSTTGVWARAKSVFGFGKRVGTRFADDDCLSMAAAVSFYTVFSLPSLLLIVIAIVGFVFDTDTARTRLQQEADQYFGTRTSEQIDGVVENAKQPQGRTLATVFGIGALLFGATGALSQLQDGLNKIYRVEPDPSLGGMKQFVLKRIMSLAMVLVVAFLLLVALVISAFLSTVGDFIGDWVGSGVTSNVVWFLHLMTSLAIILVLFGAIFKVLPDAEVGWKDAAIGGLFTALLFISGKSLFSLYLGKSDVGSAYGAAGSLLLMIMWIYYSALILLLGAQFTWCWSNRFGTESRPSNGAVHVEQVKLDVRSEKDADQVEEMRKASTVDQHEEEVDVQAPAEMSSR